jgi:cellulose synthase/poly-beta-1,6-N-acetylglucosamine synthase-like glycosyltransferase
VTPAVSVVVPTRNRPDDLRLCLEALAALDPPPGGFETIVVDDGSEAPLDRIVEPFDVRLVRGPHRGPSAARNAGIGAASAPLLAFTDDDCRPRPDWLRRLVARLEETPDAFVGGRTVPGVPGNRYVAASEFILGLVYAHFNPDVRSGRFVASNNLAVRTDALRAVGGFAVDFVHAEDRELCDRWVASGRRIVVAPEAVVEHRNPRTLRAFAAQHFRYGRGASHFHRVRSRRGSGRLADDATFHRRLPALLRDARRQGASAPADLLLLWQAANAAGFAWEGVRRLKHDGPVSESENGAHTLEGGVSPESGPAA